MTKFHTLKVCDVRQETKDCVSVAFRVPADLTADYAFRPGQYLTFRRTFDGEEIRRSYSICSGADDGELRIAVKKVPGGRFSTYATEAIRVGDALDVMTPMGRFTAPIDTGHQRHYVMFAAGSGITPIMSLTRTILAHEPGSRVTLFYGNRDSRSIIFAEELEDLKNRHLGRFALYVFTSRERQEVAIFNGRLDAEKVRELAHGPGRLLDLDHVDVAFVCGPGAMIDQVTDELARLGVPAGKIMSERFLNAGQAAEGKPPVDESLIEGRGEAARVTVILDGAETGFDLPFRDGVVLDGALKAGVGVPFSCKSGVCTTCRARLREGKVDMAANYSLEPWELEAGFILTCQARPLTDTVVVDYDEV